MKKEIGLGQIFKVSEDLVCREVHGEFVIIPITSGIGDLEDEIFSLNATGKAIWENLDGKKTLAQVALCLSKTYSVPVGKIEKDCLGLARELLKRKMLVAVNK